MSTSNLEENLKTLEKNIKIDREKLLKIDQIETKLIKNAMLKKKIRDKLDQLATDGKTIRNSDRLERFATQIASYNYCPAVKYLWRNIV